MKIEINADKWGFGFYSDFLALDFTWGFLITVAVIYFVNKVMKRNNLHFPKLRKKNK